MMAGLIVALFYIFVPFLILHLCDRFSFLKKVGSVILAYFIGIVFGSLELVPREAIAGIQDMLINLSVSLAIPLLLFSTDLKKVLKLARKTLISLVIALFSVVIVVFAGYLIFNVEGHPEFEKIAGLLVGVYTGGTPNLAALQLMLGLDPEIYLAVHTYDMVISTLYLFFLMVVGKRLFSKILPGYIPQGRSQEAVLQQNEDTEPMKGLFKKERRKPLFMALLLALVIFVISAGIMSMAGEQQQMAVFILTLTTLSIFASFNKKVRNTERTYDLGIYFILIFSIVVSSKVDPQALSNLNANIFLYVTFVVAGVLLLHVLLSSLFRIDTDTVIITSTALVCSPPFVPVVAGALKNREIIVPGITVGLIGYSIGNYLGYLMVVMLGYL
jgi:uncharacterized membrane protein